MGMQEDTYMCCKGKKKKSRRIRKCRGRQKGLQVKIGDMDGLTEKTTWAITRKAEGPEDIQEKSAPDMRKTMFKAPKWEACLKY